MTQGRTSTYSVEIADEICERMANGESLISICKEDGKPNNSTVYRWLDANEEFRNKYACAREQQADYYAQQIVDISEEQAEVVTESGQKFDPDVQRDRLRIDARKWFASKVAPKKYGDKQEVTHAGRVSVFATQLDEAV